MMERDDISSESSKKIFARAGLAVKIFAAMIALLAMVKASDAAMIAEDPDKLLFKIRLPLEVGAQARIIFPDDREIEIGRVLAFPTASRHPGFTASKYGLGGQIIATAANTHHIQIDVEDGAGRTMSIVPMRTYVAASGTNSSFVIEGEGGTGLWGEYAPYVGSPVYIINPIGLPVPFNSEQVYKFAREIEIRVYEPDDTIEYFEIENRWLGRAWYHDKDGDHDFAVVESGVTATGRFEGTVYQDIGGVRANHPGVICVSTSERGRVGGFQIVPRSHMFSHEMQRQRNKEQYIVLRGVEFEELTGVAPFYRGHVRPAEALKSFDERRVGRVLAKIDGEWTDMPEIYGLTEQTLGHVEAFRIFLRDPLPEDGLASDDARE